MSSSTRIASLRRQKRISIAWRMAVSFLAIAFALLPVIYIFSASINPASSIASRNLIPAGANFDHYVQILKNTDGNTPFLLWMRNSLFVSLTTSVLVVSITSFAAYAFSRFRFRGRQPLLKTILLAQVFPNILAIVALFLILRQLGQYYPIVGIDSLGGLILIYMGGAMGFNTWLMKGFFDSIPRDLDESAHMDGASSMQTFLYIILPLVRPILVVIFILTFIGTYGDYLLARVMLKDINHFTLAVGLSLFVSGRFSQNWGPFAAGALMAAIPTLILFYFVQDQLQSGLTVGAVKG
ncbi:MAG: sugar ABC transporter permease [Chloroflexi bacterium]|nr:sugar ABC transporter permease [Chloroflexota bacterium]